MLSANLLIAGASPDAAERINSLLRNSGINIHVIHAGSASEAKRILEKDDPVLAVYAGRVDDAFPLEELAVLADSVNVPLALYTDVVENPDLAATLENTACFVINSAAKGLLEDAVRRLVRHAENERLYADRQAYLEELQDRYNLLLESANDPVAYIHEGLHVYANPAYLRSLGLKELEQTLALSLLELIEPKSKDVDMKSLLKDLTKRKLPASPVEVVVNRPDGSSFSATLHFSPARFDGEECTQMMLERMDTASELATELERLRKTDPLTHMANRKAFMQAVDEWIESDAQDATAAVLYLEPDGFDRMRDTLDENAVDGFLTGFAEVIRASLDQQDTPAHISESGFAVLARRPVASDMESLAGQLLENCRGHVFEMGERSIATTCSIGICPINRLMSDSGVILSHARQIHDEAASEGDRFAVFRAQLTAVESTEGDTAWVERIRRALGNQDLYVVQQSIVDLDGEGEQLMENVPYLHGEEGDHAYAEFKSAAERNELGVPLDRHLIPGMLRTFVDSSERQIVNLTANSITDYDFPAWLASEIKSACIEPGRLIFQVCSDTLLNDLKPAQRLIAELRPLGCMFSICDFENERRTRGLLEHLDVSFVKLHHGMTENLLSDSSKQEAIREIVDAARTRDIAVIADEVADTTSLATLWQCGVKLISGTFLSESSDAVGH